MALKRVPWCFYHLGSIKDVVKGLNFMVELVLKVSGICF